MLVQPNERNRRNRETHLFLSIPSRNASCTCVPLNCCIDNRKQINIQIVMFQLPLFQTAWELGSLVVLLDFSFHYSHFSMSNRLAWISLTIEFHIQYENKYKFIQNLPEGRGLSFAHRLNSGRIGDSDANSTRKAVKKVRQT